MSYLTHEESADRGEPFELYAFQRGAQTWRYTSASHDMDIGHPLPPSLAGLYASRPMRRGNIAQGPEAAKNSLMLTTAPDLPLLDAFRGIPDSGVMTLTVMRLHIQDLESEVITTWTGRVLGVKFAPDQAEINCEPVTVSLKRNGLRRLYSKTCTHVLYGVECGVAAAPVTVYVTSVERSLVSMAPPMSAGDFAGGWLETMGGEQRAMIVANTANAVTLIYPLPLTVGDAVRLVRGCDHTLQTCIAKFGNRDNFGGFPWIPDKNPFETGIF